MFKVASRIHLEPAADRRLAIVPTPAPAPAPKPVEPLAPAPTQDFSQLQASMSTLAESLTRTNELVSQQALIAAQSVKPKKLEAVVLRDSKGRMEKIIVTVVQGAA